MSEQNNILISEMHLEEKLIENDQGEIEIKNYLMYDIDCYETFTSSKKKLFIHLLRTYGRCTGKLYIDKENRKAIPIGYTFSRKEKYNDCNEYFNHVTLVHFHNSFPKHEIKYDYREV